MTDAELHEFVDEHPTLYHMAVRGSWPSIRRHGLLSAAALLDLFGVTGAERERVVAHRRPDAVPLERSGIGRAVIRDQKPMDDAGLARCLRDGLAPADWYRLLNARVFLWPSRARLVRLLGARTYRADAHDIVEVETAPLVAAYRDRITLAPINTGATRPFPAPRGRDTIVPIPDYPYAARRKSHRREPVVELAVRDGVPDIAAFVQRVVTMRGTEEIAEVWRREASV